MAVALFVDCRGRSENTFRRRKLLENLSDTEIKQNCGINKMGVERLFLELEDCFEGERKSRIPIETKILTFLSFMRSGSFQWMVGGSSGTSQPSVSKIIEKGTTEILKKARNWIKFPQNIVERNNCIENFYQIANFPKVVGVVDGTHVAIKGPSQDESNYVNRKLFHSINVQVVANHNYQFHDVIVKWPGSTHDSFIWRNSSTKERITNGLIGDNWLLGDSGYPQEPWLMTPYPASTEDPEKVRYNTALSKTRCTVECTIGNWKSRFRNMDKSGGMLCYEPGKCCKIIMTSCVLHNMCCKMGIEIEAMDVHYRENVIIPQLRENQNEIDNLRAEHFEANNQRDAVANLF